MLPRPLLLNSAFRRVERRLLERRLVEVPERRRVRHPLRAAAERLAELERRLPALRFGADRRVVLPELRRRVAAAFLAALDLLDALRRRVAAPFFAAARRLVVEDVRRLVPRRFDAPRLAEVERLFALRRRVRHAFFAAAERFALVIRPPFRFAVRFAVRLFGARCVLLLVDLVRAIFVVLRDLDDFLAVRFRPFFEGGLTKTSSPSAIVPPDCGC
jgi:hypothetical protein